MPLSAPMSKFPCGIGLETEDLRLRASKKPNNKTTTVSEVTFEADLNCSLIALFAEKRWTVS